MSTTEISTKNTKNEILDAYHDTLREMKELKKQSKIELKKEQDKQEIITQASGGTIEQIVTDLSNLKLNMTKLLEELENQLLNEHKKLSQLNQAIDFQKHELEELYEIKVNTDTLAALLQTQKIKKTLFEQEMVEQRSNFEQEISQKRAYWKREQEETASAWKEQENLQKKLKQREEEDYIYTRNLERQKEQNQYLIQKEQLEKELVDQKLAFEKAFTEREANILAKEQELESLKMKVEEFPKKMQEAIQETEKTITEHLKFKYDYEVKLTQKEVEGERKLHQQMIAALENKIAQQEQHIQALTEKANHAGIQVQEIAVKAIEGASSVRQGFYPSHSSEKNSELTKN
jgi:hypothetical protein